MRSGKLQTKFSAPTLWGGPKVCRHLDQVLCSGPIKCKLMQDSQLLEDDTCIWKQVLRPVRSGLSDKHSDAQVRRHHKSKRGRCKGVVAIASHMNVGEPLMWSTYSDRCHQTMKGPEEGVEPQAKPSYA